MHGVTESSRVNDTRAISNRLALCAQEFEQELLAFRVPVFMWIVWVRLHPSGAFTFVGQATQFALLLVGGQGCYEVLRREPMLHSRLYEIVRFQELSDPECCQVLPAFHPLYSDVAPE